MTTSPFALERQFTDTYRRHLHEHPAVREAACLRVQFPALFQPIQPGDLFAGRVSYRRIGFGLEQASGGPGCFCWADDLRADADRLGDAARREAEDLIAFWAGEATITGRLYARLPADIKAATTNRIANMEGRLAGPLLDFAKLARVGLPGLIEEVEAARMRAIRQCGDVEFFEGMRQTLDLLADTCRWYAAQARDLAGQAAEDRQAELWTMADTLEKITVCPPESLREAMQLVWLYALMSGVVNYGRLDVALGDFLAADLDSGRLTEAQALALLRSLWQLIADRQIVFNGRIIIGGRGRPNEANADRFALLAMEATRTVIETEPQLSLRFYQGMNPALMQKALDVIGEGRTFPMLYNDDVNVPAVAAAFGVSLAEAEHYLPYGCGEYALDHIAFGSPNCSLNLLKALEAALHNGRDALTGAPLGLQTGSLDQFQTFDDLWTAYTRQVEYHAEMLARRHRIEYEIENEAAAFLMVSLLYDDCIARGQSVVGGGARYRGCVIESFGLVNAADSLTAIQQLVYDEKKLPLPQLVAALDANFEGFEREHRLLLNAPKYGNDDDRADRMAQRVSDHASRSTQALAARLDGLDYTLIVNINNHMNVGLGQETAASADGRKIGEPLANANNPTAGNDRKGVTAFLNSLAKLDPSAHAGYVQNMKFSKSLFMQERPKLEALLDGYWAAGGAQAMITVVSRGDLEAAMREPEKYRNLIVRVGGFSARFVELSREVQLDLLKRTLY